MAKYKPYDYDQMVMIPIRGRREAVYQAEHSRKNLLRYAMGRQKQINEIFKT